jgi:hypothetical protein
MQMGTLPVERHPESQLIRAKVPGGSHGICNLPRLRFNPFWKLVLAFAIGEAMIHLPGTRLARISIKSWLEHVLTIQLAELQNAATGDIARRQRSTGIWLPLD